MMTIQIATRQFPDPGNANKYVEDPKYPSGRVIIQIPEIERRQKHIDLVEPDHPLLPLVIKCLKDRDTERPSAQEMCEELAPLKEQELVKREEEMKKQKFKREEEEKERQRKKELEEQARKEEIRCQKEEKEKEREARRAAKAATRAEAARKKEERGLDDNPKLSVGLFASSKKKLQKYTGDGFDLDLTYIKPNIIAMAFPCEKVEGLFRNKLQDVVRFLEKKHPDHYKLYNLCSERWYDPGRFHQRVATYPVDEDNPPVFEMIKPFCDDDDIKKDDRNVAVVHCDDGLGRTGTMCASYLLHAHLCDTSKDALRWFDEARTYNAEGVTIPSQKRYVQYYSHLTTNQLSYSYAPVTVLLKGIRFEGIPHFGLGGCSLRFAAYVYKERIVVSKVFETNKKTTDKFVDLTLDQLLPLCGNIKIVFYNKRSRIFRFWFHTYFVDNMCEEGSASSTDPDTRVFVLPKAELDGANEDTKHYPPNFEVQVLISSTMAGLDSNDTIVDSVLNTYEEGDLSDMDPEVTVSIPGVVSRDYPWGCYCGQCSQCQPIMKN